MWRRDNSHFVRGDIYPIQATGSVQCKPSWSGNGVLLRAAKGPDEFALRIKEVYSGDSVRADKYASARIDHYVAGLFHSAQEAGRYCKKVLRIRSVNDHTIVPGISDY